MKRGRFRTGGLPVFDGTRISAVCQKLPHPVRRDDLVMRDGATLVFVEVKYRSTSAYGSPLEAVDFSKQNRIKRTALFYLAETNCCYDVVRFDVVGITKIGENVKYRWVKGAFQ